MFLISALLLGVLGVQSALAGNSTLYQANATNSADISYLLSTAQQTISKNASSDHPVTFAIGIGSTVYASVFANWPVIPYPSFSKYVSECYLLRSRDEH